jgi:hypothetical protein
MKPAKHRIFVMLGFHTSFYHSWRGDTPDEAGFGVDIRVVGEILRLLNDANASGLLARGYWDIDVHWTIEKIIQPYAPELLDSIWRRVEQNQDDIVLGSYNNGANHAATLSELRAAIAYARVNPFGSGLGQLFSRVTPVMRPQECMLSSGQNAVYRQAGIEGLVMYYAGVPFNTFGAFIPALSPEQRYNLLRMRSSEEDTPIEVWPCISQLDLFENTCLEALLLKLRKLQTSGQVKRDLLVHLNFDADADLWLPFKLPRGLRWFPNLGGLREYIQVVNRYPWAAFTVPSEYRLQHPPLADILVRQDLADGGFDGNYSWAEKYTSLKNWTLLEKARLHTYRAEALLDRLENEPAQALRARLWEGRDSAFFMRMAGLSTTHFGMSTPVINSERQAVASALLTQAWQAAASVEREAARVIRLGADSIQEHPLYRFELAAPLDPTQNARQTGRAILRLPILLPPGAPGVRLVNLQGQPVRASLVAVESLPSGETTGELLFWAACEAGKPQHFDLHAAENRPNAPAMLGRLQNEWIDLVLADGVGIRSLAFQGEWIGDQSFLQPTITYRSQGKPVTWTAQDFKLARLPGDALDGVQRARLTARISIETGSEKADTELAYSISLFDDLPYLLVDVEVRYARTPARDVIENAQQRLRRLMDLRWIETAPCQLKPKLDARAEDQPLRIWKHNAMGVTSYYDLNYGKINPRNRNLDSFNHQVTHGWVAVSDGKLGLLIAERAETLASMAFCPMRLREQDGIQHLWLNPFGTYFGRQLDYTHLGGNGAGAKLTEIASSAQRPNAPSFNGQRLAFSLLLAPYRGNEPDSQLQADAQAFFYPPGGVILRAPEGILALTTDELTREIEGKRCAADPTPLPIPFNVLANPSDRAIDLTWESAEDERIQSYEVRWRRADQEAWNRQETQQDAYLRLEVMENDETHLFQVRTKGGNAASEWSESVRAKPGMIRAQSMVRLGFILPALGVILRLVTVNVWHAAHTAITRPWREK